MQSLRDASRRDQNNIYVRLVILVLAAVVLIGLAFRECRTEEVIRGWPDVIFFNGQIVTVEPDVPEAQALALRGEVIVGVGSDEQVLPLQSPGTRLIDLGGRALLPGFVDAHNHVFHSVFFGTDAEVVGTTYDEAQQAMLAVGMTTHANPGGSPDFTPHFMEFAGGGGLRVRASLYLLHNDNCSQLQSEEWYFNHPPVLEPTAMFRIPGIKIFADGGTCGKRVALTIPEDDPYGDLFVTREELAATATAAQVAGYQVATHAIGDRALDTALNALAMALGGGPNTYRHRIEHNRIIGPDQLPRYGELGVVPVVFGQPATCSILDGEGWSSLLSDNSVRAPTWRPRFDPWRSLLDANPGLRVAWHSDFPYFALEPLTHLWSLVTRKELRADGSICEPPEWLRAGAVTVEEAIRMMTIDAAYALFMDDHVGSLRPGKFADLIILSANPLAVDPDALVSIEVLMTMVGGRVEHCAPGHASLCPGPITGDVSTMADAVGEFRVEGSEVGRIAAELPHCPERHLRGDAARQPDACGTAVALPVGQFRQATRRGHRDGCIARKHMRRFGQARCTEATTVETRSATRPRATLRGSLRAALCIALPVSASSGTATGG